MRIAFVLPAVLIAVTSCSTLSYSSDSTHRLVDKMLLELEKRVPLSEQRLYVAPFFAADRESEQEMRIMDEEMWKQHRGTARLLRHEVLGYLAPQMYVLDVPDSGEASGPNPEERIYQLATEADATIVIFGRYSMEASNIRVLLRAVDVPTRTVLIAEDGLVGHVATHGH